MGNGILLDKDGFTELSSVNFGAVESGQDSDDKKFFIQNDKDRVVSLQAAISQNDSSDLYNYLKWALDTVTLSCPYNVALVSLTGGILAANTTYHYRITAYNAIGETVGSIEKSITTTSVKKTVSLSWDVISGATGYIVYRTTSQGDYTDAYLYDTGSGAVATWVDDGTEVPASSLVVDIPEENTTAGDSPAYGSAPSMSAGTLSFSLEPGEQKAIWAEADLPLGLLESDNPRIATLAISEV
jgi:hypothetical protein